MSNKSSDEKKDRLRRMLYEAEQVSLTEEAAVQYLRSQGLDPEVIRETGKKRIKELVIRIEAERARHRIGDDTSYKQKAAAWVDRLLKDENFSFADFARQENLMLHDRNPETISQEAIRNALGEYYTLKFSAENKNRRK
ncbi:MAG TPA: hypothetical protein VG890_05875 [Puia sp.]|nr:hypothetical protein [Puia sp.]